MFIDTLYIQSFVLGLTVSISATCLDAESWQAAKAAWSCSLYAISSQPVPPTNGRCVVINHNHARNQLALHFARARVVPSLVSECLGLYSLAIMPRPPNKILTLAFVIDGKRVLLGYKKRGFGKGWWNGFGGKVHHDESVEDGAKRWINCTQCYSSVIVYGHLTHLVLFSAESCWKRVVSPPTHLIKWACSFSSSKASRSCWRCTCSEHMNIRERLLKAMVSNGSFLAIIITIVVT